jgi:hypothetical protein
VGLAACGEREEKGRRGRETDLSNSVVDLVRSGVVEILSPIQVKITRSSKTTSATSSKRKGSEGEQGEDSLEPDLGTSSLLGKPLRLVELTRSVHVAVKPLELLPERRVRQRLLVSLLQLEQTVDQRLGNVLPSELSKPRRHRVRRARDLLAHLRLRRRRQVVQLGLRRTPRRSRSVRGRRLLTLERDLPAVSLDGLSALLIPSLGLSDDVDKSRADDDSVRSRSGNGLKVVASSDTEADGERGRGVLADSVDEVGKGSGDRAAGGGTGGGHLGDDVDKGVGDGDEGLHSGFRGGGGDEGDVGEAVEINQGGRWLSKRFSLSTQE